MSRGSVAASVRSLKGRRPELYCTVRGCLWQTRNPNTGAETPCRKHPVVIDLMQALKDSLAGPAPTKPSVTERIARFRVERVMSHVVEHMTSLHEVWTATDVTRPNGPDNPHRVGIRSGEAFCWQHQDGECDAPIAVQHARMCEVLGEPAV